MRTRPLYLRAAIVLLAAIILSACAGDVGKYRHQAVGGPAIAPEAVGPAGSGAETGLGEQAPVTGDGPSATPATLGPRPSSSGAGPATANTSGPSRSSGASSVGGPARSGPGTASSPGVTREAAGPSGATGSATPPSGPATPVPADPSGTTVGVTKDTVTIGLFTSKTGAYAGLLRNLPGVVEATFAEAGPIHGRRVVLKTYDDGTANASTIQVEEKRAKTESFALMSGVGESNVVLGPLADQHRVPTIVANIDEQVALPLNYVFAVTAYWRKQATILPGFIKNELGGGGKRIGIVYEGTSTARNGKEAFKTKAAELGLDVVFEQPIAQNQSTCANEVSNLQSHRVEIVFMMNGPLGAICMLRDARALAYRPTWTGVGLSWNINVVSAAAGGGADGIRTLSTGTTLESPAGRRYVAFARKYLPNSGADEDDLMLLAYGFTQTLLEGLRRSGPNLTREAFVQTFETRMGDFDAGYLPPPTFGPGNRSGPTVVGVTACCTAGKWTTPRPGWRASF